MATKRTPQIRQKARGRYGRTAVTTTEKKWRKIDDLQGLLEKIIKYKSRKIRFTRAFKPKNRKLYETLVGRLEVRFLENIAKMHDLLVFLWELKWRDFE